MHCKKRSFSIDDQIHFNPFYNVLIHRCLFVTLSLMGNK